MALFGLVLVTWFAAVTSCGATATDRTWRPQFPQGHELITNEVAYAHPDQAGVHRSPDWLVTSGSLFADDGTGSTGRIDGGQPDVASRQATGSAVFRAVSVRRDFQDVAVSLSIDIGSMTSTPRTPAQDYDGVHVFLRYQHASELYTVDLCRRDNSVAIKRKVARAGAPDGGDYTTLAQASYPCRHNAWTRFTATVRNQPDGVFLSLQDATRPVVTVVDRGVGADSPLRSAGRVGLRGDNTAFRVRSFVAAPSAGSVAVAVAVAHDLGGLPPGDPRPALVTLADPTRSVRAAPGRRRAVI